MFIVTLIRVGNTKASDLRSVEDDFTKRLSAFCSFKTETVTPSDKSDKKCEGAVILKKIKEDDFVVLLDELGREYTSEDFAKFTGSRRDHGDKLVFIIGGAYGVSDEVKKRANSIIAISKMTFPHQLVRLIFLEQLYRAFTILKGMKYHH